MDHAWSRVGSGYLFGDSDLYGPVLTVVPRHGRFCLHASMSLQGRVGVLLNVGGGKVLLPQCSTYAYGASFGDI